LGTVACGFCGGTATTSFVTPAFSGAAAIAEITEDGRGTEVTAGGGGSMLPKTLVLADTTP
jgi:hypothetical protein